MDWKLVGYDEKPGSNGKCTKICKDDEGDELAEQKKFKGGTHLILGYKNDSQLELAFLVKKIPMCNVVRHGCALECNNVVTDVVEVILRTPIC